MQSERNASYSQITRALHAFCALSLRTNGVTAPPLPPCERRAPERVAADGSAPNRTVEPAPRRPPTLDGSRCALGALQKCVQPRRQCDEHGGTPPAPALASRQRPRVLPPQRQPGPHPASQRQQTRRHAHEKQLLDTHRSSSERGAHEGQSGPGCPRRSGRTRLGPGGSSFHKLYRTCDMEAGQKLALPEAF